MTKTSKRIAKQPREIADCVSAYLLDGDIEGITSMFHPDCLIFFPPDQPPKAGLAGARSAFKSYIDARPEIRSEIISEVIVGEIALLCANWSIVDNDGAIIAKGQSTEVAKRLENGGWGYLIDCPLGPPLVS